DAGDENPQHAEARQSRATLPCPSPDPNPVPALTLPGPRARPSRVRAHLRSRGRAVVGAWSGRGLAVSFVFSLVDHLWNTRVPRVVGSWSTRGLAVVDRWCRRPRPHRPTLRRSVAASRTGRARTPTG